MKKTFYIAVLMISILSNIFLFYSLKNKQDNQAKTTNNIKVVNEKPKNKVNVKANEKPIVSKTVYLYLDSGFLLDIKDIISYWDYKGIFANNWVKINLVGYTNELKTKIKNGPDDVNLHFSVFWTMFDEYRKDKSIRWVWTAWRWTPSYWATSFKESDFANIKKIWITWSWNDINLLWNLFMVGFWLNPIWKEFIETTYDNDKYKDFDDKTIDLAFLKWNKTNNFKKYTILRPIKNNTYYPFRTIYTVWNIKDKTYLDKFLGALDKVKKDIADNPDDFKSYVNQFGPEILRTGKDDYYNGIKSSIVNLDTKPNESQLSDSIWIYLKTKGIEKKDLNLSDIIYK